MNDLSIQDVDSRLTMLFRPDELAAHEYLKTFERVRPLQPERRLMLAVLEDAIMCFQRYFHAKGGKERQLYEDAVSWIFDRHDIRTYSFENVCGVCGLDAGYLRMGLLNWREMNSYKLPRNKALHGSRNTMQQWDMRGHKR